MAAAGTSRRASKPAAGGRPARVGEQVILDAAIEIGLAGVTLKQVAERLGVTIAALYRHIGSRDELVRRATLRLAQRRQLPPRRHAHWVDVMRAHARGMVESFVAEPQLIRAIMDGALGPVAEIDFVEQFAQQLTRYGFAPAECLRIHQGLAMLAAGAAVGAIAVQTGGHGGTAHEQALRRALTERAGELPLTRAALPAYLKLDPQLWERLLDAYLADLSRARNEVFPGRRRKP